jgi:hypothetical protein
MIAIMSKSVSSSPTHLRNPHAVRKRVSLRSPMGIIRLRCWPELERGFARKSWSTSGTGCAWPTFRRSQRYSFPDSCLLGGTMTKRFGPETSISCALNAPHGRVPTKYRCSPLPVSTAIVSGSDRASATARPTGPSISRTVRWSRVMAMFASETHLSARRTSEMSSVALFAP